MDNVRKTYFYFDLLDDNDKIKRLMEDDTIKETAIYLTMALVKTEEFVSINIKRSRKLHVCLSHLDF